MVMRIYGAPNVSLVGFTVFRGHAAQNTVRNKLLRLSISMTIVTPVEQPPFHGYDAEARGAKGLTWKSPDEC